MAIPLCPGPDAAKPAIANAKDGLDFFNTEPVRNDVLRHDCHWLCFQVKE
jgi:hypothetical protein